MGHSETFAIVTEFAKAGYEPVVYPIIPGSDLTSEELVADYGSSADIIMCVGGDGTLNHTMSSIMELDESVRPPLAYVHQEESDKSCGQRQSLPLRCRPDE